MDKQGIFNLQTNSYFQSLGSVVLAGFINLSMKGSIQVSVPLPSSPHPSVRVVRLFEDASYVWNSVEKPFQGRNFATIYNNSFVVHNDGPNPIVGVYAIWKITRSNGKVATSRQMMDIFLSTVPTNVLPSKGQLVLYPRGWIAPANKLRRYISADALLILLEERLKRARNITVAIDSVIFSDGEIWGHNTGEFDKELHARKTAAANMSALIKTSRASGVDWLPMLHNMVNKRPEVVDDYLGNWQSRFATQLLAQSTDIDGFLKYLDSFPVPPTFVIHRRRSLVRKGPTPNNRQTDCPSSETGITTWSGGQHSRVY